MQTRTTYVITLLAALVAIAVPIIAAIFIANNEAMNAEVARALGYAHDVMRRSEMTTDQIDAGINSLHTRFDDAPCSPGAIAQMRRIDLASSYIQAIGHLNGTHLECTSLGISGVDLGPPDLVQPSGAQVWMDVMMPNTPGTTFLVVGADGFAAIINKDLPVDAAVDSGVSLATVARPSGAVLITRGALSTSWIKSLQSGEETTFVDQNHLVAVVASKFRYIDAIAAVPVTQLGQRIWAAAALIVPLGIAAGVILALAVLRLARRSWACRR